MTSEIISMHTSDVTREENYRHVEDQEEDVFPLPSDRARNNVPDQGWKIATKVRLSNIPGAGNGRFSVVDLPKDTVVMVKPIIPMAKVSSIYSVSNDEVVLFKSREEVERFISLYDKEGYQTQNDTLDCLAHFIWSLPSIDGVALNFTTWSMNHGDPNKGENIRFYEENGKIVARTVTDVKIGDELLNDYRDFDCMDDFWIQLCKDKGVKDVVTNLKQHVNL